MKFSDLSMLPQLLILAASNINRDTQIVYPQLWTNGINNTDIVNNELKEIGIELTTESISKMTQFQIVPHNRPITPIGLGSKKNNTTLTFTTLNGKVNVALTSNVNEHNHVDSSLNILNISTTVNAELKDITEASLKQLSDILGVNQLDDTLALVRIVGRMAVHVPTVSHAISEETITDLVEYRDPYSLWCKLLPHMRQRHVNFARHDEDEDEDNVVQPRTYVDANYNGVVFAGYNQREVRNLETAEVVYSSKKEDNPATISVVRSHNHASPVVICSSELPDNPSDELTMSIIIDAVSTAMKIKTEGDMHIPELLEVLHANLVTAQPYVTAPYDKLLSLHGRMPVHQPYPGRRPR